MAFVSMLLVLFCIIIIIFSFMIFLGLIFLIVGLIKSKKYKGQGKKYPKVLIGIGGVLFGIPVAIVLYIGIGSMVSEYRLNKERENYTCFMDKWRNKNEWVEESEAEQDVLNAIFEAVEKKDSDAIREMFTKEIKEKISLSEINGFINRFPKDIEGYEMKSKGGATDTDSDMGVRVRWRGTSFEMKVGECCYHIRFGMCFENDKNADAVGLEYFHIESEKVVALDKSRRTDEYLVADIEVEEDFEVRRIRGNPRRFVEIDRTMTQEQVLETLQTVRTVDEFIAIYGEPNAEYENMNELYYELEEKNGEAWYLALDNYKKEIRLTSTYFTNGEGNDSIWLDEEGNLIE